MPTDLPKNYSGSRDIRADRKAARKAARRLACQSLWGIAKGLTLHYVVSLAGVAVIAAAGFHGVWRASLSATALGLLARWFLPNKTRTMAEQARQPQLPEPPGIVEITPQQLSEFLKKIPYPDDGAEAPSKPTPYL